LVAGAAAGHRSAVHLGGESRWLNGNVAIEKPFTATFYMDAALTKVIDSVTITPNIRGYATGADSLSRPIGHLSHAHDQ
jgi:hypothetical protein